ncbi:MAG TPA: nitroreductase family protein [Bryobacteraceae bacterium]|nr:nitroreductase family protein [Bryobacteraceae bacterium]
MPLFDGPAEKLADTLPGVHELIRARWSPRAFSSRDVSDEDLKTILDAARWAASSNNEQPWRFLVARKSDPAAHDKLLNLLLPGNQSWAKFAPVLMIMAAKRTFSHNGAPNLYAVHDTGQALAHLFLQATALGLHAHGMAGFDRERARKELHIPDDYELGAAVALGYLGSPDQLSERHRQSELARRQRKPLNEIVFGADWNQPLTAVTGQGL